MKVHTKKKNSSRFRDIRHPYIYKEQDIALSNVKVNIHIRLDADLVSYFKEKAQQEGGKYQSLINQHLRETVLAKRNLENRVRQIEERLAMNS
ncbi:MAG: BrnA antitoxin family protein [Candidatus Binatia bacterium]